MGNPFQDAAVELNCAILGFRTKDGRPDAQRLKALGGGQNIRFLQSSSDKDCNDGDQDDPVRLIVPGYGHVDGDSLAAAVKEMKSRIEGSTQTVDEAAAQDEKKRKSKS